jgi:predicted N-acyltransferase
MSYSYRVFDSIAEVELAAWQRVCAESGATIFMDPRFIASVETSMKPSCRFWYVIVYDDARPVACAGLSAMVVNLAELSDPRLAWVLRHIPVLSKLQQLNVLFCSLPGSPGEKSLALTQTEASAQVLSVLDGIMHDLAKQNGIDVIVYKEFRDSDLAWMNPLLAAGYRRIPSPPMHVFGYRFADFKEYCAALKTRYRQQINRSVRKLEKGAIAPLVLSDTKEILERYTPEVHALYQQMVAKSDVKLEVLPIEYFRQIALELGAQADLITLLKDSKIIAFGWALRDRSTYHLTYAGVDYSLNHEFDLYFNLMYAGLDRALRDGFETINVGQTAAAFKARIGCENAPLYVFAKGLGPVMSRLFYYGSSLLLIQKPADPPLHIFKSEEAASDSARRRQADEKARDLQTLS